MIYLGQACLQFLKLLWCRLLPLYVLSRLYLWLTLSTFKRNEQGDTYVHFARLSFKDLLASIIKFLGLVVKNFFDSVFALITFTFKMALFILVDTLVALLDIPLLLVQQLIPFLKPKDYIHISHWIKPSRILRSHSKRVSAPPLHL